MDTCCGVEMNFMYAYPWGKRTTRSPSGEYGKTMRYDSSTYAANMMRRYGMLVGLQPLVIVWK